MSTERKSSRPGGTPGKYDELKALSAQQDEPSNEEKGKSKGDGEKEKSKGDGRGEAVLDREPKPQPGDELHATLHRAKTEMFDRAAMARLEPHTSAAEFAAVIALTPQHQHDAGQETGQEAAQIPDQAHSPKALDAGPSHANAPQGDLLADYAQRRHPDGQGRGNLQGMKAEQAAMQGQQSDLKRDFVTEQTQATVKAERAEQQQRPRTYGPTM